MKILTMSQHSDEWFHARAGMLTASKADAILTPKFKVKDGNAVDTLIAKCLAEKWTGGPLPEDAINTLPMEYGSILEERARPAYTLLTGREVRPVGLITDDDGVCGASPDGLIGDDCGIEIKCPNASTHVKYLLAGEVPHDYLVQVHFSMFVTGFPSWVFMSYRHNMPPLILTVQRDDKIQAQIAEAAESFKSKMAAGWQTLVALNGGAEPERQKTVDEFRAEDDRFDINN
jgi:putative phage-type endonuclease